MGSYAGFARLALTSVRTLPPRVALFLLRARWHAERAQDRFSLDSAIRPKELEVLLTLVRGCATVIELGTGTSWSAIALALGERDLRVITYDPCIRRERERYLALAGAGVAERIEFRDEPDISGPRAGESVEMLFVDSSHDRESVLAAFGAWRAALVPGAIVAFHDYDHPGFPGVREAIEELGLAGVVRGGMFVWRAADAVPVEVVDDLPLSPPARPPRT